TDQQVGCFGMRPVNLLDDLHRAFNLVGGQVIRQADVHHGFDVGALTDVNDVSAGHVLVWDTDEIAIEIAHARAPQTDRLNIAVNHFNRGATPSQKLFARKNCARPKEVGGGVWRGEANRETPDGEGGEQAGDVHAQILGSD